MGNFHSCLNLLCTKSEQSLAINANFNMTSSIPPWPSGGGFAKGSIDLGGLEVRLVSTFTKIWSASRGGPDNVGATFFSPSSIPNGFFALGSYAQPNSKPPFGRVLVAKDTTASAAALAAPTDYVLIWTSGNGGGYFWLPVAPSGYHPVGYLVTTSPEKPSPDFLRCVRDDFTDQCEEGEAEVWSSSDTNIGITVRGLVPSARSTRAAGLPPGTFIASTTAGAGGPSPARCLKNKNASLTAAAMPNLDQINAIIKAYSPVIYFHPDEAYLPSSVGWFFDNGALLYSKADPTGPVRIDTDGANLPQGGSNDGAYWLDLPAADADRKRVKKGDLLTATAYVHVKPMLGGTATDVVFWVFYPFNGPARAKVGFVNVGLGRIGEHVGDWEHVTVRVSNFDGQLIMAYFSEHSGGRWVEAAGLEFVGGGSGKPAAYAALGGHAFYAKAGLVLQGSEELGIGIKNDAAKGKRAMDTGERFKVVAAEYLGEVVEPLWLQYMREWGLRVEYEVGKVLEKVESVLPERWRKAVRKVVEGLPAELLGEEGPTGPKVKASWDGDEA